MADYSALMEDSVAIPSKRYKELIGREAELTALEAAGVENWEGYELAMDSLL